MVDDPFPCGALLEKAEHYIYMVELVILAVIVLAIAVAMRMIPAETSAER